jgi:hypothetical protein
MRWASSTKGLEDDSDRFRLQTNDQVTIDSAEAILKYSVGVKVNIVSNSGYTIALKLITSQSVPPLHQMKLVLKVGGRFATILILANRAQT